MERLRIAQLTSVHPAEEAGEAVAAGKDIAEISEEDWAEAQRRFDAIKPLLDNPMRTREAAEAKAKEAGVHVATLYEWLRRFQDSRHLSCLIPGRRGPKRGGRRLSKKAEAITESVINQYYLSNQRPSPGDVAARVVEECKKAGLKPPHPNTVRNRIRELPRAVSLRRRGRRDEARNMFQPIRGGFPGADFPLSIVQIDHTEADIIVVEEETRLPMGRPWVTLAIDVYSRMVVGIYISMDPPSAVSVGMCLANGMLPKEGYLADLDVPGEWPVWGKMRVVHADNAKEFRGAMLQRACEQYAIELQLRPVKLPHYGGHIERLMGTNAKQIHKLPGTTFASPAARSGYDSEGKAALTLREFEQQLVDYIVNVYHQREHSGLGLPPKRQWEIGVLGNDEQPGIGVPDIPADPARLRLDFLPYVMRTVQTYGIQIDKIFYFHEVLTPWINAMDPSHPKAKRQFIIRRDPRDISRVYFFDPEANEYYTIPYRNVAHPAVSLWEVRAAQRRLAEEGRKHVDEDAIFEAVQRMRERVEEAKHKSKKARRQAHRVRASTGGASRGSGKGKRKSPAGPAEPSGKRLPVENDTNAAVNTDLAEDDLFSEPVTAFDDLGVER
ncbi:Mu transposase C-terminal domain-containing protein [Spiribacter halobius]|nr:Mu transposase C-terminal domain-containing protein [Spiribacter halobius]UEX77736.1 Mu transposase C-terminal domain-containing protein [Spiribacter halobius]